MARRILGRPALIGKRWPHRALNFLPAKQLWKYLSWKSGDSGKEPAFNLGKSIGDCRKILILVPESFQEILVSIPILQTLAFELPNTQVQILVNEGDRDFLAGIFEPEKVIGILPEEFYWGESHFREIELTIRNFQPTLALNLRNHTSPLVTYLIGASKALLRVQICSPLSEGMQEEIPCPTPFVNIRIQPTGPSNYLRRYVLATSLWNFTPNPMVCKWSRFKPSANHLKEALSRLLGKGLRPESTRLFLWRGDHCPYQQAVFHAAVTERHRPGETQSLAILIATGGPFSTSSPSHEQTAGIPCLEAETTGLLLAFFSQTAKSIGLNSPLLHLASLSETDVEAHFEPEEEPWNTSFLNPRFQVIYRKREG